MLAIRCLRSGRTNTAFFRIVLTESSRPPKSGFISILGWYNPHTKESSLQKEDIVSWLDKGAKASNTVARILESNGIKHKQAKFIPDTAKASKSKEKEKSVTPTQKPAEKAIEAPASAEATPDKPTEEKTEEVTEAPEETPVTEEPKTEEAPTELAEEEKQSEEGTDKKN